MSCGTCTINSRTKAFTIQLELCCNFFFFLIVQNKFIFNEINQKCEREKDNYYKSNELYRLIWKPIETMLANATKVYFSPIGELYNIALENVPGVEKFQKASFYRVSTTKNIITDSNINTLNKKAS